MRLAAYLVFTMARLAVVKQIEQTNDMARHEQPPARVFPLRKHPLCSQLGYEGRETLSLVRALNLLFSHHPAQG